MSKFKTHIHDKFIHIKQIERFHVINTMKTLNKLKAFAKGKF